MAICMLRGAFGRAFIKFSHSGVALRRQTTDAVISAETGDQSKEKEHSENGENNAYEENIRQKILQASLPFVHELGWSKNAISAGAGSLGYPGVIHGMFPRGGADLVSYFYSSCNQQLASQLKEAAEKTEPERKDPQVVVSDAVETRLRMITPYLTTWPQALALMTLPPNVPTALANLLTMVDDICYYAGDRSVDFNWYSRRVALAAIYKMTELYLLQDQSADHAATWQFLRSRIDEAAQLHSVMMQSESGVQFAKEVATATFTTARNILGLHR
ncbi:ubiquinone biosynthesis protein COQ9, mitochondrial isoform X3 [Macrosteles quadrilineatus]|uniref:ubiquinone biosynthesis protein COQ9, mitochondrial isoform X3 n=1 Tax=Macrosteles quadrilineatus TaxID=74068 RepID=UPI0023E169FA|nr:ubiquinone biosynthesis protein COQ9, mitochondrial isoform X3 [Macrosteles quadrilineatus]